MFQIGIFKILSKTLDVCVSFLFLLIGGATKENQKPKIVAPQQPVKKGIKHFKLSNITHRMDVNELERMAQQSFKRVLDSESECFFNPFTLRVPQESIVCYFHTFEKNLEITQILTKYLKESCW